MQVRIWYCDWLACVSVEVCLVIVDILVLVPLAVVVIVGVVVVVLMIVIMVMMVMPMPMPMPVPVPMVVVLVVDDLLAVARPGLMVALDIMTVAVAVPALFLVRVLLVHWRVSAVSPVSWTLRPRSCKQLTADHTCTPP